MKFHARSTFTIVLLTMSLVLAACSADTAQTTTTESEQVDGETTTTAQSDVTTTASSSGDPQEGGTLRVMLHQDEGQGFDPAILTFSTSFVIAQQIYDTLVELNPEGELVPGLAESWDISDDGLTYTFDIREGVVFHDGSPMTSEDVKYTIDRLRDPDTGSPRAGLYSTVNSVEAPDGSTVVVNLTSPFAPFLAALADITAGIVTQEAVEAAGEEFYAQPVGTGAFMLSEWTEGQFVELAANEDYWRDGVPYLDGMRFTFNNDANARTAAVRAGDVDFLFDGPDALLSVLQEDDSIQVFAPAGQLNWTYLLVNQLKEPFDDVRVRQAIHGAIDRQAIVDLCVPTSATVLNSGIYPESYWASFNEILYPLDVDKSLGLLADAGYPDGFSFTITTVAGWDKWICTAQVLQQQLAAINLDVQVQVLDVAQTTALLRADDMSSDEAHEASIRGFSGTIDPDERFQQTFQEGGGTNYPQFSDPEVDVLAAQARVIVDRDERAELYRQAQARMAEVGPWSFLYNYFKFDVLGDDVRGYVFNPNLISYSQLRDVWIES